MGLEFLDRVRKTSILSALIVSLITWAYGGLSPAVAFLLGCAWSLVNIHVITVLVRLVFSDPEKRKRRVALVMIIKIPALYAAAYLLLEISAIPVVGLLSGFTWPLLVVGLKAAGRFLLGLEDPAGAPDPKDHGPLDYDPPGHGRTNRGACGEEL